MNFTYKIVGVFQCTLVTLLILLCFNDVKCQTESLEYYENLIENGSTNALLYNLSQNAWQFRPLIDIPLDLGSYDFIVIGSGSTGSVIANRLSEISNWNVLLLEAGQYTDEINNIPALFILGIFSSYNWGYQSVPQTTACLGTVNQICQIPAGRGVGGTTLLNGLFYSRGNPIDFNTWANLTGDPSWAYENVLQYFKKSEDLHKTDPEAPVDEDYHATGGLLYVENHSPNIDLKYVFLNANIELGYNITDYNSPNELGGTILQFNTKKGRRYDHGTAFVVPALNRSNLDVLTGSYVTKLIIDNVTKEATGCIFTRGGLTYKVSATKEVILSAGTISSPRILMSSGIGPRDHLDDIGIPVVEDLSVGSTLQEQITPFGIQFSSNLTNTDLISAATAVTDYLNGTGLLTSITRSHVIGWYNTSITDIEGLPDFEILPDVAIPPTVIEQKFIGWTDETWNTFASAENVSFKFNPMLLHPRSFGTVRLKSNDPFDYPLIDYKLLSDPDNHDIDALYEAVQFCLKLIETNAFKAINAKFEIKPLPACEGFEFLSKDYWYCFLRQVTVPEFHPVGTCPMGADPAKGAVVDSNLKVFGVKGLRVADASIFPTTTSGHPSAGCTMVGEKVSDAIKADYLVNT